MEVTIKKNHDLVQYNIYISVGRKSLDLKAAAKRLMSYDEEKAAKILKAVELLDEITKEEL